MQLLTRNTVNVRDERGTININDYILAQDYIKSSFDQLNLSKITTIDTVNSKIGTFRGFHYQIPPFPQIKIVRAISGSFVDLFFDYRLVGSEITNNVIINKVCPGDPPIVVPPFYAHATFCTSENTIISYLIFGEHSKSAEKTISISSISSFLPISIDVEGFL